MENLMSEITLDGFQVVSGDLFITNYRKNDATCTIWPDCIQFSKQSILMLNACENIRIEVNAVKRCILVSPVPTKDRDAVKWCKDPKTGTARKIVCYRFAAQLYELWGWEKHLRYRTGVVS